MGKPSIHKRASCKGCIYHETLSANHFGDYGCFYILHTGMLRGCPPENCDKKITGRKKRKKRQKSSEKLDFSA